MAVCGRFGSASSRSSYTAWLVCFLASRPDLSDGTYLLYGHVITDDWHGLWECEYLRQKILHAKRAGNIGLVIVPTCNLDEVCAEGWASDDELQYVEQCVRGVSSFADVIAAAIEGEYFV